jgi:hypothetical protein
VLGLYHQDIRVKSGYIPYPVCRSTVPGYVGHIHIGSPLSGIGRHFNPSAAQALPDIFEYSIDSHIVSFIPYHKTVSKFLAQSYTIEKILLIEIRDIRVRYMLSIL